MKNRILRPFFTLALIAQLFVLVSCAGHEPQMAQNEPLTPMQDLMDPSDLALDTSVKSTLADMKAPLYSGYEFRRVDLNDDGRRDALVLFKTPYGYWCGTHGCTMLVMEAHNDHFTLLNSIQPVRAPVHISENKSNGWKDLIIRVSGRWDDAKDVAAKHNGSSYPLDPADIEPASGEDLSNYSYLFR